jgi:ABC-type multidrug transport system fused ATPase/permease subunit
LLVFIAYLSQLYSPIRGLARLSTTIYSASAGAERIIELLDSEPAVRERPHAVRLARPVGAVEFDAVSFRYPGAERDALEDLTLAVGPGETLAFVGRTGAGKSTVAKLLLRFYDPGSGTVRLDGHDLRGLKLHSLREAIALLLQETLVLHGTVRENIAYGKPGATDAEVLAAAEAAGAHEFVSRLPEGYETLVGERGRRLSGGQRQRIAIARAMIRDAPVLILDEPTTGLDAEAGRRLLEPLRRLIGGRTTIVISHNLLVAREATAIIVLDAGRAVECGCHEELLERGGLYAALSRAHRGAADPAFA